MISRLLGLLCMGTFTIGLVVAQPKVSNRHTTKTNGVVASNSSSLKDLTTAKMDSIPEIAQLFADNYNLKDSKKISNFTIAINESLGYGEVTEEDLMFPSVDLYGKDSWRTDCINPFRAGAPAYVPDSFYINLSQFSYPLDKLQRITSRYGYRSRFRRMHYGIDIKLQVGDTVRAAFDGKVRIVDYDRSGYGKYVVIRHVNGLETFYAHCSKHLVTTNQIVRAGEPIALGGNTGRSTGSHLHFEARFLGQPINPEYLINFNNGIPKQEKYLFVKGMYNGSSGSKTNIAKRSGSPNGTGIKMHKIKSGDTLSGIASKYGTSVNSICKLNGISTKTILRVGKTLRVG